VDPTPVPPPPPVIEHCYREFLVQNYDPGEREYPDPADQIREVLIHSNYLSQRDIEICLGFDLACMADRRDIEGIRTLHEALKSEYGGRPEQSGDLGKLPTSRGS